MPTWTLSCMQVKCSACKWPQKIVSDSQLVRNRCLQMTAGTHIFLCPDWNPTKCAENDFVTNLIGYVKRFFLVLVHFWFFDRFETHSSTGTFAEGVKLRQKRHLLCGLSQCLAGHYSDRHQLDWALNGIWTCVSACGYQYNNGTQCAPGRFNLYSNHCDIFRWSKQKMNNYSSDYFHQLLNCTFECDPAPFCNANAYL